MIKTKTMKKGDENKMEHKDLWLVIGLTVILAVAVSVSTVSLTGDFLWFGASKSLASTSNTGTTYTMQNKQTTCEPDYIQTLWQGKAVSIGGKKVTLVTVITVPSKREGNSNVEIDVDGIKDTIFQATDFHNNLKTINGLTFKVNGMVASMSPSTGVSSAQVMIGTCRLTNSCPC